MTVRIPKGLEDYYIVKFAWCPVKRWVKDGKHARHQGWYWWRKVALMESKFLGKVAWADYNDARSA